MERSKTDYIIIFSLIAASLCIIVKCVGKVLVLALIPFVGAWIISLPVKPLSESIAKKLKLKQSFCATVLIIAITAVLSVVLVNLFGALIREASSLVREITEELDSGGGILAEIIESASSLGNKFSSSEKASKATTAVYNGIRSLILSALETFSSKVAELATAFIGKLPGLIFAIITCVISLFYICSSKSIIHAEKDSTGKSKVSSTLRKVKDSVSDALGKYLRSYLIILLITFAELFLGFVILRIDYALLLSLTVAIIDFLPVLGTGIVIIPWSIACLLTGKIRRGVGLIVIWVVMYLVRQLVEPRIVSGVMGIHPLASLFAIYLGYISCGVLGMIMFPILLYLVKAVIQSRQSSQVP